MVGGVDEGFPMSPTIVDGPIFEEYVMIIIIIKRESVDRPHLRLVTIHPKETNSNEFSPLIFGGAR